MKDRRYEKTHIEKGIPVYPMISAAIAVLVVVVGLTNWAGNQHAKTNLSIVENNKRIAINAGVIASEKETREQDRKVTMRFYTSIEREVTDIKRLMIKRDDKINDFMIKVLEK